MARYPSRRPRSWIYIIFAILIIAVVIAFIYGPGHFGKSEEPSAARPGDINTVKVTQTKPLEPGLSEILGEAVGTDPKANELIAEAQAQLKATPPRIIAARDRFNEALAMSLSSQQKAFVKEQLSALADKWLFSRTIFPDDKLCGSYQVQPADQLRLIAPQFKVPYQILMEINNITRADTLRAGEVIKVINGPFHARVYRSTFTMDLYLQNTFVRSFPVGLGRQDRETPTGLWLVQPGGKLIKPPWTDPDTGRRYEPDDPDYPLGSRWIGLKGIEGQAKDRTGFAIHGTKEPTQIGAAGSRGCIRAHNGDAILLYNLLEPGSSKVEVVE